MAPLLLLQQHAFHTFVQLFAWTVTVIMFALHHTPVSVQTDGWEMIACKVPSWYFYHSPGCTLLYNNIIVALCKHVNECYNVIFHRVHGLLATVTAACISYICAAICVDCDSNHVCIAPDTCVCPEGWMGDDCMQGTQLVFLSFPWLYIAVQ